MFDRIYSRICGAGSFYDGLKVGKPEEFDMDTVFRLPVNYEEAVVRHLAVSHPIFQAFDIFFGSISDFTFFFLYLLVFVWNKSLMFSRIMKIQSHI